MNAPSTHRAAWMKRSPRAAVLLCFILGTTLPAIYGMVVGIRVPRIHDENSYLLGADTFAHGRLSNPAPAHPEFFEAEHVLVVPSYSSKYPPGQGLALAAGQVLFARPIWGVWLSCGALAASVCWMLQSWTSRRWAWICTLFFLIGGGISSYWAQSYWGGAVAGSGAALLFGAMRRTVREPRVGTSLLLGLGAVLLAITRPYEGLLAAVAAGCVLGWWFLFDGKWALSAKTGRVLLPSAAVLLGGAALLAAHDHAVTGDWRVPPYPVHHRQYFHSGFFLLNDRYVPERQVNPRITEFYATNDPPKRESAFTAVRNFRNRGAEIIGATLFQRWVPLRERWLAIVGLVFLVAMLILAPKDLWFWFCVASLFWLMLGASVVKWWMMHYSAPAVPLVLALFANACRRGDLSLRRRGRAASLVPLTLLVVGLVAFVFNARTAPGGPAIPEREYPPGIAGIDDPNPQPARVGARYEIARRLRFHPGRHLVFVRYADDYPLFDECVYNAADLPSAPVIFAHSYGLPKDHELVTDFPGRSYWLATVATKNELRLSPYEELDPRASANEEARP